METKYQTSFIPKKPVIATPSKNISVDLFFLISIIIFLISLGLAGYVFLAKKVLIQKIVSNQKTIEDNKNGLTSDSITIESLVEFNSRINTAKDLLDKHISISPIFDFLQQTTLKSVSFKNFNFTSLGKDASGVNKISVQMLGIAKNWETVASQADEFGKADWKKIIDEPKISNLSVNTDGSISFQFSAFINPEFLSYK
ncbi:MAG: hypothetical protein V1910_00995 [bacterium]